MQTFNDGVVRICKVDNVAPAGDMPKEGLHEVEVLRYEERIVGMSRYWQAHQYEAKLDRLIRCHRRDITTDHIAVIGDVQFTIKQVQRLFVEGTHCMDLSLERMGRPYGT